MGSTIYSQRARTFIGADGKKHWLNILGHEGRDRLAVLLNELTNYIQDEHGSSTDSFADLLSADEVLNAHVFAIMDLLKLKREWLNDDLIYTFLFSDGEGDDDPSTPGLLAIMHQLDYNQVGKAPEVLQKSSYYRFIFNVFLLAGGISEAIAALQKVPYDVLDGIIVEHNSYLRQQQDASMSAEDKTRANIKKRQQEIMDGIRAKAKTNDS